MFDALTETNRYNQNPKSFLYPYVTKKEKDTEEKFKISTLKKSNRETPKLERRRRENKIRKKSVGSKNQGKDLKETLSSLESCLDNKETSFNDLKRSISRDRSINTEIHNRKELKKLFRKRRNSKSPEKVLSITTEPTIIINQVNLTPLVSLIPATVSITNNPNLRNSFSQFT